MQNDLTIVNTDATNIHQFGMCGYKDPKNPGYQNKLDWLKQRYDEGLRYKMLVSEKKGAIGGIEYIPGEYAWRPVVADGFMFIHCIFIIPKEVKGQGYGKKMVEACISDARQSGMKGVAVVTRKGTWMAGKELFLSLGFEVTDTAKPDFELLTLKFDPSTPGCKFTSGRENSLKKYSKGLYIITSGQCPYTQKAVVEIGEAALKDYGIDPTIVHLENASQAREVPCAFGSFCMIYNGKIIADHPISQTRFRNILGKMLE